MEKELFIDVLKHYSKSSENEALNVISLKQAFPYSQVLHALAARLTKDHSMTGKEQALQSAAIYASDRGVLKNVMTLDALATSADLHPQTGKNHATVHQVTITEVPAHKVVSSEEKHPVSVVADPPSKEEEVPVAEHSSIVTPQAVNGKAKSEFLIVSDGVSPVAVQSVADQVMDDLEKLHRLKRDFEVSFVANQAHRATEALKDSESATAVHEESGTHRSRRSRIIEAAKSLIKNVKEEITAVDEPRPPSRKRPVETIIDEIANGKQKIEPESPKQMEQIQMIDRFIQTQPTISNKDKIIQAPEGDLATIKTGEFTDNIVSETLVEILLKQGKRDKAIEVLKKLIWKFPQKKAYFAAQIEDLKK